MYVKYLSIFIICLSVLGCQSPSPQTKQAVEENNNKEESDWKTVQMQTIEAMQNQDYVEAGNLAKSLITSANKKPNRWQFIRMVLAALPADMAQPLISLSLDKPYINQSAEDLLAFSRLLMHQGNIDEAINVVNQVIGMGETEESIYWRARLQAINNNLTAAEKDYQWLLEQNPDEVEFISQYAALKTQQGHLQAAEDILKSHLHDSHIQYQYILLLLQQNKIAQAEQQYQTLKSKLPELELSAEQKLDYGEVAMWLEDYVTALRLLNDINDAELLYPAKLILGRIYLAQNNPERAMVLFKQVQNAPQEHAIPAFQMLAEYYQRAGDSEQALAELTEGLRFFNAQEDLLYSRALLHAQLDNVPQAEADLKRILKQDPNHADALNALGYTWADNDMNLDMALDYINKANNLKPNNAAILDSLGWVYYKQGELIKAEHFLREALRLDTNGIETHEHLIDVLESQNKTREADAIRQQLEKIKSN